MFKIKNNEIYHTRGDTGEFALHLKDKEGTEITQYEATLSVKKNLLADSYLFQCELKDSTCTISHDLTKDIPFGNYVYDIEIQTTNGKVFTIGPYAYHLLADVTK